VEGVAPAPATRDRCRGRGRGKGNSAAVALQRPARRMPTPSEGASQGDIMAQGCKRGLRLGPGVSRFPC
jgi:hypothetical protein